MIRKKTQTNNSLKRRLITVHSQKGGVGKTIVALYIARRLTELYNEENENKMNTVLIDADLTGTSIADVLELASPECNTVQDTINKNKKHREDIDNACWEDAPCKTLNRFLFCNPWEYQQSMDEDDKGTIFNFSQLLWSWNPESQKESNESKSNLNSLHIIPSSSLPNDIADCIVHIYKDDLTGYLETRFTDLVMKLWRGVNNQVYQTVVIDTPPVLQGLSRVVLKLHKELDEKKEKFDIEHHALFVSGPDLQDVVALSQGIDGIINDSLLNQQQIKLIINRIPETAVKVQDDNFMIPQSEPKTREYYHKKVEERYKQSDNVKSIFLENSIIIPYESDLAISFMTDFMKFSQHQSLETLINLIRKS